MITEERYFPSADYDLPIPEDDDDLNNEITRLAGHINAATYRFLKLLAEQIRRGTWVGGDEVKSPAHWLNYRCGITLGAAGKGPRGREVGYIAFDRQCIQVRRIELLQGARHGAGGHTRKREFSVTDCALWHRQPYGKTGEKIPMG
jgi:hypothetical protein|tara:strand:+ start:1802 stop:2239 length:438 start_codon:yes stop_codon:yes gene_type:complete